MVVFGCVWLVCLLLQLPMQNGGMTNVPCHPKPARGPSFCKLSHRTYGAPDRPYIRWALFRFFFTFLLAET
uniref:Putative secreted peptide n=1 Tax=Anopheles braziliensis TaxID=58242 RepID=A0A2M3ZWL6_9DIPT